MAGGRTFRVAVLMVVLGASACAGSVEDGNRDAGHDAAGESEGGDGDGRPTVDAAGDTDRDVRPRLPPGECSPFREPCTETFECCEGFCHRHERCLFCVARGGFCIYESECCSGLCDFDDRSCRCSPPGNSCSATSDCCEGVCNPATSLCE